MDNTRDTLPLITIIISTKNEEKNIENCLRSIKSQDYPEKRYEIILVDNFSQDKTIAIAQKYTENIFSQGPERSTQRNFGFKKAKGDYILFLDADMMLSENVLSTCVKKIQMEPELIALYIAEIVVGNSYFHRVRNFERSFYDATVIDCVRFIKSKVCLDIGGFDENLTSAEDWDFDKRIRMKGLVGHIASAIFHNEAEMDLKKYLRKKHLYGDGMSKYIAKWGTKDSDVRKQFGMLYRFVVVFVEDKKYKNLLKHPLLSFSMIGIKVLIGIQYITQRVTKRIIDS
ncbi:glycosyltransferase [Patescibacteria group bacterium]|nr:glycosyltransferase [Patescibacteria group bacterium]